MASLVTQSTTLDDLPEEMVCEVLRRLSLADIVRLKMTAKRYRQIVSDFRMKRLIVGCDETNNSIDHCHPNLFSLQIVQPTLSQLRELTIEGRPMHFDLNELNRFTRLTRLKIAYELPEGDKVRLDLPDLRQLEVTCNNKQELNINSTKLEKLTYYGDANLLRVEHPETVFTLDSNLKGERLRSFCNVHHLRSSSNLRLLTRRTLLDFPNLKEVAYTGTLDDVWEAFDEWERIYELSPYLQRFMDKKKALGRTDLKVQFVSFVLVDHKPIKDYKFDKFFSDYNDRSHGSFMELDLHAHNYDQVITFSYPDVDYYELMSAFGWRLPDDFFNKFVDIESVETRCHLNEEELLWFLQSVPELIYFTSDAPTLSESFFWRLAEICSDSLQFMSLHLDGLEKLQNLDFAKEFKTLDTFLLTYMNLSLTEYRLLLGMSWPSKTQFDVRIKHKDRETKLWVEHGVMRTLDSEEAVLYRYVNTYLHPDSDAKIPIKSCPLTCLNQLAEEFEKLQAPKDSESLSW